VNALCLELRRELQSFFLEVSRDDAARAIVLCGGGRGFSAGGDRTEFGTPAATTRPTLSRDVLHAIEHCGRPVVAALHGFAIGGGLELALACDLRVVVAGTRVGFPEVGIGRFPLSGSQRLPRILGVGRAAAWMLRGETTDAGHPEFATLFDRVVDDQASLLPVALERARAAIGLPPVPIRRRPFPDPDPVAALEDVERANPAAGRSPAQQALLDAVRAAVDSPDFQSGLDRAQQLFDELVDGTPRRDRRDVTPR
jgi:3-hydroxyacyl-CoA dehydrogenase